jgi:hypothetical protein
MDAVTNMNVADQVFSMAVAVCLAIVIVHGAIALLKVFSNKKQHGENHE